MLLALKTLEMQQAMDKLQMGPSALASFMSTRHKLESSERREHQLRKCLVLLVIDGRGPNLLWVVPPLSWWSWVL